ncbi:MAG: MarC family protein [Candidatus ainarchaeum sp.]|nr:MarC family protein [Candidatus ainarchaeum sp.]
MDSISMVIASFVTIFAIMDPFASLPLFLAFTRRCNEKELRSVATKAVLIAGCLAFIFTLVGPLLLSALSITLSDFKIAGGIVLVLLGLENSINLHLSSNGKGREGLDSAAVLIGTPLLTGPGLMTSLVILDKEYSTLPVFAALLGALLVSWVILMNAGRVRKVLGDRVIMVTSKVIGLFLIAMGIAFIRSGLVG